MTFSTDDTLWREFLRVWPLERLRTMTLSIINEHTPLPQTLLGLSSGGVGDLMISGQMARQLRLLKIQRQGELLL
jgi:hypothetical protein